MQFLCFLLLIALLAVTIRATPIGYGYAAQNPYQQAAVDHYTSGTILDATGIQQFLARRSY